MIVSLILGLPDCTMKTSFSRTLLRILTLVSPCCKEMSHSWLVSGMVIAVKGGPTNGGTEGWGVYVCACVGGAPTFENWVSSASAGGIPRFSHILLVSVGQDEPPKIKVLRIVLCLGGRRVGRCRMRWF